MTAVWVTLGILAGILLLLLAFWLFALAPNPDGRLRMEPLSHWNYAHRGFYRADQTVPENTLAAYQAAVEAGFGIELDVRLTKDKAMVIHHDDSLKRLCGLDKKISESTLAELSGVVVGQSSQKLPLFAEALQLVDGKVPLIVEIKTTNGNTPEICPLVAEILSHYKGPYMVESFDPQAVRWFKKNRPEVIRGLLVSPFWQKAGYPLAARLAVNLLLHNLSTRPDFVAYDIQRRQNLAFRLCKRMFGAQEVSWTVKTPADLKRVRSEGAIPIFEQFDPRKI